MGNHFEEERIMAQQVSRQVGNERDAVQRRQVSPAPVSNRSVRRRALKSKVWQDWFTGAGDAANSYIIQDSGLWLDLLRHIAVKVKLELIYTDASTTELKFETSNTPTGPWTELNQAQEFNTVSTYVLTFSSESAEESRPLRRFLRWKATGSAANWSICFYLTYEPLTIR